MSVTIGLFACTETTKNPYKQTRPVPVPSNPVIEETPVDSTRSDPTIVKPDVVSLPPNFTLQPPGEIVAKEGELIVFKVNTDVRAVVYGSQCLNICPQALEISSDGEVRWTPSFREAGIYDIRFSASDEAGQTGVSQYTRIRVANVNRNPSIVSVSVVPNDLLTPSSYSCEVTFLDLDVPDIIQISRKWQVNGKDPIKGRIGTKSASIISLGTAGDSITCEATAKDSSNALSATITSEIVLIPNSSPVIISSGVVASGSLFDGSVPEDSAGQNFKVGDRINCVVSLYDREGGTISVPAMVLIAMPMLTIEGEASTRITDLISLPVGTEILATFAGSPVSLSPVPPFAYAGRPFSPDLTFGVSASVESYLVPKRLAHRPLTCVSTVLDGDKSVREASFVSRIKNSEPTITGVIVQALNDAPNVSLGGTTGTLLRTGGISTCLATYADPDGDDVFPSVIFKSTRGNIIRDRVSPSVRWQQACVQATGLCTSTGNYRLNRWTDIAGDSASKDNLSDIHGDQISCQTYVSDLTVYGPKTVSLLSSPLTVQDSPPTLTRVSQSGELDQTIRTGESYRDITFLSVDADGDLVSFASERASGSTYCELEGIASLIDTHSYPAVVVSQIGKTPLMAYPHHDRSCKISIIATSGLLASSKLSSTPVSIALTIPNQAPKLFCGKKSEIVDLIQKETTVAFQETFQSSLNRYLKTGDENVFGAAVRPGQSLGKTELGATNSPESDLSSVLCTVVDLDGMLQGASVPSITVVHQAVSAAADTVNWTVTGSAGCTYQLADGQTTQSLGLDVFGDSAQDVRSRSLTFDMGVSPCSGTISVNDGEATSFGALSSNSVLFNLQPKINLRPLSVVLDPYCRLVGSAETSVGDHDQMKLPVPSLLTLTSDSPISVDEFPAFVTIEDSQQTLNISDQRTSQNISLGLKPFDFDTINQVSSSPDGFEIELQSRPDSTLTTSPFIEDFLSLNQTRKDLTVSLTIRSVAKQSEAHPSTQRTAKRDIVFASSDLNVSDMWSYPRKPSFANRHYGADGMQVHPTHTCVSEPSCGLRIESSISAGETHTCFVTEDGGVNCFGGNVRGQIGMPISGSGFKPQAPSIPNVKNITTNCSADYAGVSNPCSMNGIDSAKVLAVSVGVAHSCGLTSSGEVLCWGDNSHGQLGLDVPANTAGGDPFYTEPHPEADYVHRKIEGVSSKLQNVVQITSGPWHTCALTTTKDVYCWGANPAPEYVLTDIVSLFCGPGASNRCVPEPTLISSMSGAVSLSAGGFGSRIQTVLAPGANYIGGTTCGVMKDGSTKCYGDGFHGLNGASGSLQTATQLPSLSRRSSLIEDFMLLIYGSAAPVLKPFSRSTLSVTLGRMSACAISLESTACWGGSSQGDISDPLSSEGGLTALGVVGFPDGTSVPTLIPEEAGRTVAARSIGIGFSCDITSDASLISTVRCAGKNHFLTGTSEQSITVDPTTFGALGSKNTVSPFVNRVGAIPTKIEDGTPLKDVVALSAGSFHACAITRDGEVHCWGSNFAGQVTALTSQAKAYSRVSGHGAAVRTCTKVLRAGMRSN